MKNVTLVEPKADIEAEGEWVDNEEDSYNEEDDEDEVFDGTKDYHSDSEDEIVLTQPKKTKRSKMADRDFEPFNLITANNICKMEDFSFNPPPRWPPNFQIMSMKGGAGFCHNGYIFKCVDEGSNTLFHHFKCEGCSCRMTLTSVRYDTFKEINVDRNLGKKNKTQFTHTCNEPNYIHKRMFRWYLRQFLVTNNRSFSKKTVMGKTAHLDLLVQNSIGNYQELRGYFASIGRNSQDKKPSPLA